MHVKVRELLAKAAYHGITRREIAKQGNLAVTTFTNWRKAIPRIDTLCRAEKALDEIIAIKGLSGEKMES